MEVAMTVSADAVLYPINKTIIKVGKIISGFLSSAREKKELLQKHGRQIVDVIESLPARLKKIKLLSRFGISKQ